MRKKLRAIFNILDADGSDVARKQQERLARTTGDERGMPLVMYVDRTGMCARAYAYWRLCLYLARGMRRYTSCTVPFIRLIHRRS